LLATLKRFHPNDVVVKQFSTKIEGSVTGADWEWWFHSDDGWFGMRVQAKRINCKSRCYPKLNKFSGSSKDKQVDRLITDAEKWGLYPIYCFYNYWDTSVVEVPSNCRSFPPIDEHYGCTVSDAYFVRSRINLSKSAISDFLSGSFPWMCLVCCKSVFASLPYKTRAFVEDLLRETLTITDGTIDDDIPEVPPVREEPPEYIQNLVRSHGDLPEEINAEEFGFSPTLNGVLLIGERKEE
jgi:hypothetical protein